MARRRAEKRAALRRVEALLDGLKGRTKDDYDRRRSQWQGYRTLDLNRDGELFNRLVALDFDYLLSQNFAAGTRVLSDLLPQSVLGRAQNGHGYFTDEYGTSLRFPDATFERILSVLEASDPNLKGHLVRQRRGQRLSRFGKWLFERLDAPELELTVDGEPLLGVEFLGGLKVETRPFVTGLVLAGFMDDWGYRRTTMLQHKRTYAGLPFHIGGGEILVVDRDKFNVCGFGDTGSTLFLDDQMRTLRDIGVVCRDQKAHYAFPEHDHAFFRRGMGDGVCDDLALMWVGAHHGFDAMLGAFVMDAIDTYDKFLLTMTWGGFDAALAMELQGYFQAREDQPLVGDREILDLIFFAAKRNFPPVPLSSSHRRLIQVEPDAKVPTLLNHWRFLQGEPVYEIKLGFNRIPARQFYEAAWQRFQSEGLTIPEPQFSKGHGPDRPRQK